MVLELFDRKLHAQWRFEWSEVRSWRVRNGVPEPVREVIDRLRLADPEEQSADPSAGVLDYLIRWVPVAQLRRKRGRIATTETGRRRLAAARRKCVVAAFGESKSVAAWARDSRCTVSDKILKRRLEAGMDPESAISTAVRSCGSRPAVLETHEAADVGFEQA